MIAWQGSGSVISDAKENEMKALLIALIIVVGFTGQGAQTKKSETAISIKE